MNAPDALRLKSNNASGMLGKDAISAARGIGILLVVLGHMRVPGIPPINPYGFHIPLFFFLSGMALRSEPPLRSLVARDARSLLLYAVVHFGIFAAITTLVLQPVGFRIATESPLDWRTYLVSPFTKNSHHVQLFLIAWFLFALFFARTCAAIVSKAVDRLPRPVAILSSLLIAAVVARIGMRVLAPEFALTQHWYWNLASQVAVGTSFCILGYVAQRHGRLLRGEHALAIALGLYLFLMTARFPAPIMAWSQYPGGFMRSFAFGVVGTLMVAYAAHALREQTWLRKVGSQSKAIMAWHLTGFAALNLVFVSFGWMEARTVGPFTLLDGPRLWPVYLVVSVIGPIVVALAWRRLRLATAGAGVWPLRRA